jgi:predicted AlkP superfamily phosphohydrolase/phosphomutase
MILVVGWDGACRELTDRFRSAGRMPVLDALLRRGRAWQVRSTVPAVTFPAWTSFLTAARPDHHGVTDFTIPRPGSYGVRFVNSTHRRLPTIASQMAAAGRRVGLYGIPATFPAEGKAVFEICGFDTPLGATAGEGATHPRGLADELRRRHGRLGIEGISQARIGAGWHEETRRRLIEDIALRTRIALELLQEHEPDVFFVHFMEPDTASHHFWAFDDDRSPRRRDGPRGVLGEVYEALDRSLGELLAAAGAEADVLLLSDHGSAGASDRVVFWNRWLADRGYLTFRRASPVGGLARTAKRAALSLLPSSWQARAFAAAGSAVDRLESSARFAGIDWSRTRLYSDEVPYFPSLRVNLAGREPRGVVAAGDRRALLRDAAAQLLETRDRFDGGRVVLSATLREDLFDGPYADRYPDLLLELRRPDGYAYAAASSRGGAEPGFLRRLRGDELGGAKGSATAGVHTDFGMAVLATRDEGDTVRGGECSLADLGATVLALAGLKPAAWMQGRPLVEPRGEEVPVASGERPKSVEYDEASEREVAERLRALGYLP